ncbi:MAG: type II toxin-antitoxin system RelE/ParE family toxin, partial [Candidatus Heimdallarchaeota archaeon]
MVFRIFLSKQADKFLNESEEDLNNRLRLKNSLLVEPFDINYVKIKGEDQIFRTRLGDYRILYQV